MSAFVTLSPTGLSCLDSIGEEMTGLLATEYAMAGWHTWQFRSFLNSNGGGMGGDMGGGGRTGMRGERGNCGWTVKQTNR